jgi:enoyl-CoA hydratase
MSLSEPEILIAREGRVGRFVLNRPKALNALTLSMVHAMDEALRAWAADDGVEAVVIRQAGERAFCAGGDVRRLAGEGVALQHRFWRDEYRLNALLRRYPKPCLALVDGIVMGGGVGVSIHGSHRILSENVVFAMPETAIGMIPDVGVSYELARMPGALGLYLGLTGARLGLADALHVGFGTHAMRRADLDAAEEAIAADGAAAIPAVIARYALDPGSSALAGRRAEIDRHFDRPSVEAVFESLAADPGAFAGETLKGLRTKSPTSLKLAFRLIREARDKSFEDCLRAEWAVVSHLHEATDFAEGVRALLIDKDNNPRWNPPDLAGVSEAALARSFSPPDVPLDLS